MFFTGKRFLGPDIWPETLGQAKSIENMMKKLWGIEVNYWQKADRMPNNPLFLTGKEVKHMRLLLFYD